MRERLLAELGAVRYPRFLAFLMGPYTTFEVAAFASHAGGDDAPLGAKKPTEDALSSLPSARADDDAINEMLATLRRVQGSLRTDPGVNAFLAVDAGIPLDEVDAATQSIRFTRASNAVVFVLPHLGDNLGVGMEVGAVLEDQFPDCERLLVVHEESVSSAMLGSVTRRWEARIASFETESELVDELRQFVATIMYREATGELERLGSD